ncbi:MAG: VWA domain-containing protein [Gammaproteobacteria bacterium]
MKAQSFEHDLRHAVPPTPDTETRLRARRAALAQFARVHAQANGQKEARKEGQNDASKAAPTAQPRRKSESLWPLGRTLKRPLGWTLKSTWLGGVATACVVVVGVSVVWLLPPRDREVRLDVPLTKQPVEPAVPPVSPPSNTRPVETEGKNKIEIEPAIKPVAPTHAERRKKTPALVGRALPAATPTPVTDVSLPKTVVEPTPPPPPQLDEKDVPREVIVNGSRIQRRDVVSQTPTTAITDVTDSPQRLNEVIVTGALRNRGFLSRRTSSVPTPSAPIPAPSEGRDKFQHFATNPVKRVADDPVSTFSVDVDTAAYSFVRRKLNEGVLPQVDSVRVEEMINYFDYAWPTSDSREQPFKPTVTVSDSPWGSGKKLIHIGIKGYALPARQQPDVNLVLLLDVSGSMDSPDKLPLAQRSMALLLDALRPTDTVAIVVYAGAAGQVLAPTPVSDKETILQALNSLQPGGSTAGAAGIRLAYTLAEKSFRKGGVNRILLATDGDFNVGITDQNELKGFVEREREKGVYLSVLGFGEGNYRDEMAQTLAQNGNGVAAYIDTLNEAKKVLVQEATSSLFPIAKDVKLQVEFNPATVAEYRLVGYETRALNREDFNNDKVDAGDVGSGHTVTAIYEITPVGSKAKLIDERRYSARDEKSATRGKANEYGFLRIRYKQPDGLRSQLVEQPILMDAGVPAALRDDVSFSTAVAGFAQILRGSQYIGSLSFEDVMKQAQAGVGEDRYGYRSEFVQLVNQARRARGM